MALYANKTATGAIKTTAGTLYGVVVNSHSSGTLQFNDGAGGTSAGVKATGVLTSSGVFENNDEVLIGLKTYTFKTTLTGAAFEVLIDVSAAASLDNLKVAINAGAGAGTKYGTGTTANEYVTATTNTNTAQTVEALRVGTYANVYETTETGTNIAWGEVHLESGAEASVLMLNTITLAAGSGIVLDFGEGMDFHNGLYYTEGGTADVTIIYN